MSELGFDPRSPEDWRRYAIVLYRDHQLIVGIECGDPETIEVNKRTYDAYCRHATLVRGLAIELRRIDQAFRSLRSPSQRDVLESAVQSLEAISDGFAPLRIGPVGGLPMPLEILIPELLNVLDERLSRLLTPSDGVVVAAEKGVPDSYKDQIRTTVQAYAAAAVKRLIDSEKYPTQNNVYGVVAKALDKAGFLPPGKTKPYTSEAVRTWYEKALAESGRLHLRYRQALEVTPDDDPDLALKLLTSHVRWFQFKREK